LRSARARRSRSRPALSITVADGTSIVVSGTLKGTGGKIAGTRGRGSWSSSGGNVALDGVDVSGANVAITAQSAASPPTIRKHRRNAVQDREGRKAGDVARQGDRSRFEHRRPRHLHPSYLDYDENDQHAIIADDPSAVCPSRTRRSTTAGVAARRRPGPPHGEQRDDFHVAYSDISGAHCGFHFLGGDKIDRRSRDGARRLERRRHLGSPPTAKLRITQSNFVKMLACRSTSRAFPGARRRRLLHAREEQPREAEQGDDLERRDGQIADAHPR